MYLKSGFCAFFITLVRVKSEIIVDIWFCLLNFFLESLIEFMQFTNSSVYITELTQKFLKSLIYRTAFSSPKGRRYANERLPPTRFASRREDAFSARHYVNAQRLVREERREFVECA